MSRDVELTLAAVVAVASISAMIWWPQDDCGCDTTEGVTESSTDQPPEPDLPASEASDPGLPDPDTPDPDATEPDLDTLLDDAGNAFSYLPAGDLIPDSGTGRPVQINYAPGLRFPMEAGQAYANSQVYNPGGYLGPAGGQCDPTNYAYAWRDNFCEIRGYDTPMCPAGIGHQGQDIRPASCQDHIHWAVAVADGTVTSVGTYSVRLMTDDGVRYTYLHLDKETLLVEPGDVVSRGERIGFVSNAFGNTVTTIHLHFEIRLAIDTGSGIQSTTVPPYVALVDSYERLIGGEDAGGGSSSNDAINTSNAE